MSKDTNSLAQKGREDNEQEAFEVWPVEVVQKANR
jgi:hypothetical protein